MIDGYNEKKRLDIREWQERVNATAWIQGQYMTMAIGALLPGSAKYPLRPIPVFQETMEAQTGQGGQPMSPEEIDVRNAVEKAKTAVEATQRIKK